MITFPPEFVATKFPGYFWNVKDQKLYSLKVTGVLRPLRYSGPNRWNFYRSGYRVSVNGRSRWLFLTDLKNLPAQEIQVAI